MVPANTVPFVPFAGAAVNALPEQSEAVMLLMTETGRMFTNTLFVSEHPVAVIVSVNVYVALALGVAVGSAMAASDKFVAGLQL